MRWVWGAVFATAVLPRAAAASPDQQLRLEAGVASPTGQLGLRYRVDPGFARSTAVTAGVGIGYSGLELAFGVEQPVLSIDTRANPSKLAIYAGYSLGVLYDGTRHALAGEERFAPSGLYHWLDLGVLVQANVNPAVLVLGVGSTVLVSSPTLPALTSDDDATPINAEWWLRKRFAPSLWAGIGWRF